MGVKGYSSKIRGKSFAGGNFMAELTGDWAQFYNLTQVQLGLVVAAAEAGQLQAVEDFKDFIKREIDEGLTSYNFKPLSEKYKDFKERWGGDSSKFFDFTGSYKNAIEVKPPKSRGLYRTMSVGIPWDAQRSGGPKRDNELPIAIYAQLLEVGSVAVDIPARPLWKKAFRNFGGNKKVVKYITASVITTLRMNGIDAKLSI